MRGKPKLAKWAAHLSTDVASMPVLQGWDQQKCKLHVYNRSNLSVLRLTEHLIVQVYSYLLPSLCKSY